MGARRASPDLSRRDFLRLGASAAGAVALAACGGGSPPPGPNALRRPDFKVGVILPISGADAAVGDSIRKGMQLYFASAGHRAGGRRIVVLDRDEASGDPSIPLAAARRLVEQDGVDMIAGMVADLNALAIRNYVDHNRVPTLIANAGVNSLSRRQKSRFIYRTSFSNWQSSQPMGKYLADSGVSRLVLLYSDSSAGAEIAAAIKETFRGPILSEMKPPFPNLGGDFMPYIDQVNQAGPDAVYVVLTGRDAAAFLDQAAARLDKSIKVTGSGFLVEDGVLGALGKSAPLGAITGLHWAQTLDSRENRDFTARFRRAFGRAADVFAMQGYDTARVIVEALDAVRGKTDDASAFMDAISRVSFKSPRGNFRFDAKSNNVVNTVYVRQLVKDPKLGYTHRVIGSIPNVVDPGS